MELQIQKKSSLSRVFDAIDTLDLDSIKRRLTHEKGEYRWSAERAERAELGYRRYLTLRAKYPGVEMSPTEDVDVFWHAHILDTRKYADDCQAVFGGLVHHNPALGDAGYTEEQHETAEWVMRELYEREFGETLEATACGETPTAGGHVKMAWCA
jgi:hypothetical protein